MQHVWVCNRFWICQDECSHFPQDHGNDESSFSLSYSSCPCKGNSASVSSLVQTQWESTRVTLTEESLWDNVAFTGDILMQAEESYLLTFGKQSAERKATIFSLFTLQIFRGKKKKVFRCFFLLSSSVIMHCLFKKWPEKYVQSVSDGFAKSRANCHPHTHYWVWSTMM